MGENLEIEKLIADLGKYVNGKHTQIDYYVTQFLSEHGCFASYLE